MGGFLLAFSLFAILLAAWRRKPEDWLLLAFALPYYILVGAAQSRYARYEIPLLPVLALWLGAIAQQSTVGFGRVTASASDIGLGRRLSFGPTAIWIMVAICTAVFSMRLIHPMTMNDPRDAAIKTLDGDRTKTFGFATVPWFYTPPLNPLFCLPGPGQWLNMRHHWDFQHILVNPNKPFDAAYLQSSKPDIVFLSEFEYAAPLRLGDADARAYVAELARDYAPPVVMSKPTEGVHVTLLDGLPVQALPHDMLYTNPQTLMFVRKAYPARAALSLPMREG